jgi:hypothetical protein
LQTKEKEWYAVVSFFPQVGGIGVAPVYWAELQVKDGFVESSWRERAGRPGCMGCILAKTTWAFFS